MTILPPYLNVDDLILAISPSGKVDPAKFLQGGQLLEERGFHIEVGKNALSSHFKFAGTHQERLADLQWALDHTEAKAIFCGRGGYGVTYLLDQLDWTLFRSNPKWLIGFSDITALHHAIYKQGFCSIHAPVLQGLANTAIADVDSLIDLLTKESPNFQFDTVKGETGGGNGPLIGGNLSILINQLGTTTELDYRECILFIEEVGESLYHIDRMILQLKRAGKLAYLKGLIVGNFTELKESKAIFGQSIEEIVAYHCDEYDFPIVYDFPVGHGERNFPLIHGADVSLSLKEDIIGLKYQ